MRRQILYVPVSLVVAHIFECLLVKLLSRLGSERHAVFFAQLRRRFLRCFYRASWTVASFMASIIDAVSIEIA